MNEIEAQTALAREISRYRSRSYEYLATFARLGRTDTSKIELPGGAKLQIDVQVNWEAAENGSIKVKGSIHEQTGRSSGHIRESFVKSPSGEFED
jgi:hypothetical protein